MRGLRSTLLLLVVLAGLGGYIYYTGTGPVEETEEQPKMFAGLDSTLIDDLKVKSASGDVTSLKKQDGTWKLTAPIATAAAENDATGVANALSDVRIARVVEENPADLATYGLDKPRIEVDFKTSDGKKSGRLVIGAKTATGGNLYAQQDGQKKVVLIPQFHEATLNKSTFDLRNKGIITVDRAKVDGADITTAGKTIEFAKANGEWSITKPLATRADFSAAEGIIGQIESAQMKSVVSTSPSPDDLKKFGLDKPQTTVNLHLGSARATLLVGGKNEAGDVYVRDGSRPDVFTVDATVAEDFNKGVDDFRKKELFDFRAYTLTRIELTHDGKTLTLERVKATKEGEADSWKRLTPSAADADRQKVEQFVAGLADIRGIEFAAPGARTGLTAPDMTVAAKFDEGRKEEKVSFGKDGSNIFAGRPDTPGVMRVDTSKYDEAIKAFDELVK